VPGVWKIVLDFPDGARIFQRDIAGPLSSADMLACYADNMRLGETICGPVWLGREAGYEPTPVERDCVST